MTAIIRILLRYVGVALATKGFLGAETLYGDAEFVALVEMAVGGAITAGTEVWYALAKRYGWRT